ncbi:MAG: hypothetical protein Q9169_006789 [Polycauliona sp. 2 TL-2023]
MQKVKSSTIISKAFRATPQKPIFPFLSLPAELRNKIYQYALTTNYEVPLRCKRFNTGKVVPKLGPTRCFQSILFRSRGAPWKDDWREEFAPSERPSFAPNILVLNRQVHEEAQAILYGSNFLSFKNTKSLLILCTFIGPKNIAVLQELRIKMWGWGSEVVNYTAFAMLTRAVSLELVSDDWPLEQDDGAKQAR